MMFLDCPAYLDQEGDVRCGLPAEVRCRFTMRSTDGPVESAMIRCPAGHYFCGAIGSLTWDGTDNHDPGTAGASSRARGHDGRHGGGGSARRDVPAEPEPKGRRSNTAPAYYLGHPAALWITAMRRCRRPTGSRYLMEAAVSSGNPTCPPREVSPSPVQPGLRAIITSVSPGQSQKIPSAERLASSVRTSPAKSSRRSPNRCGAENERDK